MKLNTKVYECLACPECRSPISRAEGRAWCCDNGHNFSEINDVPVLRSDQKLYPVYPLGGDGSLKVEVLLTSSGIVGFLRKVIGTNYVPYPKNLNELFQPGDLILNIGAGMIERSSPSVVNLDYFLFPSVDVVADVNNIPFMDNSFDVVLCEFMIEHVKNPFRACSEMSRVLKPGGKLYISYPFIHPFHAFPNDYFRFTPSGLRAMFQDLEVVQEGVLTGPACRWIGDSADLLTFWIKISKIRFIVRALILTVLCPLKFLDLFYNRIPESKLYAVTLFGILRKS